MSEKLKKEPEWPTVSTRLEPIKRDILLKKHPTRGEVSKVLRALVNRYLDGKIMGLKLETE